MAQPKEHPRSNPLVLPLAIALLVALNLYIFRDLWRGLTSFTFDFPMAYYTSAAYWIASLQSGEWPHWIPYASYGYASALNTQLGIFYPPFWIFVLLRIPYSLHAANVFATLHVLFGSIGFLLFARRSFRPSVALCGAVCFALFGGFYSNSEHADIVRAFAWMPWLFWALLLDDTPATGRTRIRTPNLLLAGIVYCFLTGSYPGLIISGLVITAVFIASQAVALYRTHRDRTVLRDSLILCGEVALGIGMAMVFLLPAARMSTSLMRTYNAASYAPWYIHLINAYELFLPSNLTNGDPQGYSMHAMQLPMVLLLFLPMMRLRGGLLAPLLSTASVAAVMSLSGLKAISGWIARVAPVFRLSRFPVGDYRIFIYFAVLVCALSGLEQSAWARRPAGSSPARRDIVLMFLVLIALMICCALMFLYPVPPATQRLLVIVIIVEGLGCAAAICLYWLFLENNWPGLPWVWLITAGSLAVMVPTVQQMKDYWSDPNIKNYLYHRQGIELEQPDGHLTVYSVFSRTETRRPARTPDMKPGPGVFPVLWRGYIDGSYMTFDWGDAKSMPWLTVKSKPELQDFMMQPGELLEVDCTTQLCSGAAVDGIDLASRPVVGTPVQYSRNYAVYDVSLPARSLVVENEIDLPGWSGYCETHGERLTPERVDGALRGWVFGPGSHRLRVTYRTPLLVPGAILSAFFLACWLASLAIFLKPPAILSRLEWTALAFAITVAHPFLPADGISSRLL